MALALQRDLADQFVDGIGEIGAFGRLGAVGDDEQARQPHRVIDPQHAGVAHVGAVERSEPAPALARARERIGRRQVPVLALRGERIGRRADGGADREFVRARPALRAVGRGADREIAIEADFEPRRLRARRRRGELPIGEPLAEQREADVVGVLGRLRRRAASHRRRASRRASGANPRRGARARSPRRWRSGATFRRPRRRSRRNRRRADRRGARRGRARRRRNALAARRA